MRIFWFILLLSLSYEGYTFSWTDLWLTKDQQAQTLMQKQQFKEAQTLFQQPAWRAAAAYRAGDYAQAVKEYQPLQNEQGYYNQGNALAQLGQYENAIKAYDKALAINPNNQDAQYNRNLLKKLLDNQKNKQQSNQSNKKQSEKQNKNQAEQSNQDKNQQEQQNNNQSDQAGQNNQQKQGKPNKNQQGEANASENQPEQNQQEPNQQEKQNKNQEDQTKEQEKKKQAQQKNPTQPNEPAEKEKKQPTTAKQHDAKDDVKTESSPGELEKQQAKTQWLRLIPDDPGGLMREKFLRDHLRREGGWYP